MYSFSRSIIQLVIDDLSRYRMQQETWIVLFELCSPYLQNKFRKHVLCTVKYIIFVLANPRIAWGIRELVKYTYIYLTSLKFSHVKQNLTLPLIKTENKAFNSHILEYCKVWKLLLVKLRDPILTKNPGKYDIISDTLFRTVKNIAFIRNHQN